MTENTATEPKLDVDEVLARLDGGVKRYNRIRRQFGLNEVAYDHGVLFQDAATTIKRLRAELARS